jgi:predicted AlkP superfamily phosphohydrolase/phosphomutase
MTYPVWPVDGVMVAGFPTPDIRVPYTWPRELGAELGNFTEYTIDEVHRADPASVLRAAAGFTDRLVRDVSRWTADPAYRLVMYVVSPLDYFQHRFWSLREPKLPVHREQAARYGDVIAQMYELQDAAIGRLLGQLDGDWLVAVVSDHGGGKKGDRVWNVNAWLRSRGLLQPAGGAAPLPAQRALSLARNVARRLRLRALLGRYAPKRLQRTLGAVQAAADAIAWPQTRAHYVQLFYPAAGINLNVRGRQPQGVVEPGAEYERLRAELIAALQEVTDPKTGRRVVLEVYPREAAYAGPHLESAPDIVFVTDPLFECGGRLDVPFLDAAPPGPEDWTGDHRIEGVLLLYGPGVFQPGVAPTLLHGLGLPVPADLDGRVLREALDPAFAAHPIARGEPLGDGRGVSGTYSEEEEEGIKASLRGLGYIP